jgi:hypothetical protein
MCGASVRHAGTCKTRSHEKGFARIQWGTWSPSGWFDDAEFEATAQSFANPDWTEITLNGYRGRWRPEVFDQRYDDLHVRGSADKLQSRRVHRQHREDGLFGAADLIAADEVVMGKGGVGRNDLGTANDQSRVGLFFGMDINVAGFGQWPRFVDRRIDKGVVHVEASFLRAPISAYPDLAIP